MAQEEEVVDKKAAKKAEKARKAELKRARKADGGDDLEKDEESAGGKIAVFFVTLIIVLIWLAIIVLLIKWDVGGFGSGVLAPVLKDVPYVNKILPETTAEELSTEESAYAYSSMEDAINKIKELEIQLAEAQNASTADADRIGELEAQSAELAQYKQEEAEFEAEKEKFYEEVVFSDSAPDITEYQSFMRA